MILGLSLDSELPDERLRELCGFIPDDLHLDPRGFSYGTQKLIGIANAFRLSRGLVILDEPTSGLDASQKKRLIQLINEHPEHAVLIISHDPSVYELGRNIAMGVGSL